MHTNTRADEVCMQTQRVDIARYNSGCRRICTDEFGGAAKSGIIIFFHVLDHFLIMHWFQHTHSCSWGGWWFFKAHVERSTRKKHMNLHPSRVVAQYKVCDKRVILKHLQVSEAATFTSEYAWDFKAVRQICTYCRCLDWSRIWQ